MRAAACLLALLAGLGLAACGGGTGETAPQVSTAESLAKAQAATAASESGPQVLSLSKISETRVGRTVYDYVFKITVQNGMVAQNGLLATLQTAGPGTTVLDGAVNVGNLAAGASITPADTITLRHDRNLPFQAALLVWKFSSAGPVPASLQLSLSQLVLGAGESLSIRPRVLDAGGQPILPAPAISYQVLRAPEGNSGPAPTVSGATLSADPATRGGFTLQAKVDGSTVGASIDFTVIKSAQISKNSGLYVGQAAAHGVLADQLALLAAAVAAGDGSGATAANAALQIALAKVDPVALGFSTPYEPDLGFLPTTGKLSANGIARTSADQSFGSNTTALRAKLAQIKALLDAPGSDEAAATATLIQYGNELAQLAAALRAPAARPGLFGLVEQQPQIDRLLAVEMPALLKSIGARVNAQLVAQGLSASTRLLGAPQTAGPRARIQMVQAAGAPSAFLLGGLLNALGPMGQLINDIYGDYLNQLENMSILLGSKALLDEFLTQTTRINGLKTGGSFSFHAYNMPGSYIDVSGISLEDAQRADVYLVGGAAIEALKAVGKALPPPKPKNIKELYDYFDGLLSALKGARQAYEDAHQQPSRVVYDSFDNGGCLPSLNDSCIEMQYDAGFKNVAGGSVSFTVLVLTRTPGARAQYGSLLVNIAPNT
ncbi:UNVERIFIED_ORG: hypothetical protein LHJ69_00875 [Shinella sp. XGS7]|nr:hypothetical protein [Shinella sp. XGS7]